MTINRKEQSEIIFITICIILFVIFCGCVVLIIYNGDLHEKELCTKICERKGCEFVNELGSLYNECKCIDKNGDIKYFDKV